MPTIQFHLDSLEHTERFGAALSRLLLPGDIVLLSGDLGAGKTTLVRTIAVALGVNPSEVSSPTFTVAHEHALGGGHSLVHMDAYRLEGEEHDELDRLGWDRLVSPRTIALIEWGERVEPLLDAEPARLALRHEGETERGLTLGAPEAWVERPQWADLVHLASGSVFSTQREQMADLYRWMSEGYSISRPLDPDDMFPEEGQP